MKFRLTIIALLFVFINADRVSAQFEEPIAPYGGYFDSIYDSHGGIYALTDLRVDSLKASSRGAGGIAPCTSSGYFTAYFDSGSGFEDASDPIHLARREVLCHVMQDLSRLIIPVNPD